MASADSVADQPFIVVDRSGSPLLNVSLSRPNLHVYERHAFDKLLTREPILSTIHVPYKRHDFSNFGLQPAGFGGMIPGVVPNSSPNSSSTALARALAALQSSVEGTTTPDFELARLYYYRVISSQLQQAQLFTRWNFNVSEYQKNGPTVGPKCFTFTPSSTTQAKMARATFEGDSSDGLAKMVLRLTFSAATIP